MAASPNALANCMTNRDTAALAGQFRADGEFIMLENALDAAALAPLLESLPALEPHVHRNYIPGHKKGGSISRFDLDQLAPAFGEYYRDQELLQLLRDITGRPLIECPQDDPHTYALYYYTEAGDHIGYHYDTSYYKGERFTVLIGLVDESTCRLEYELFRDDPSQATRNGSAALAPGTLVLFNGDKLWHRITPAGDGDRRVALTFEYVTSLEMHPLRRFVSNMKDAIAYFGFRQVFGPRRGAE